MKHIATAALMFNFGVTGIYAQTGPLNMPVSGTAAASTINLRPGTTTSEYQLAGNSRLGQFDLRTVSVSIPSPQQPDKLLGAKQAIWFRCGGRGRVSLHRQRRSIDGVSYRGERLHRFDGRAGALHQGFQDHRRNRPFGECGGRYPHVDHDRGASRWVTPPTTLSSFPLQARLRERFPE